MLSPIPGARLRLGGQSRSNSHVKPITCHRAPRKARPPNGVAPRIASCYFGRVGSSPASAIGRHDRAQSVRSRHQRLPGLTAGHQRLHAAGRRGHDRRRRMAWHGPRCAGVPGAARPAVLRGLQHRRHPPSHRPPRRRRLPERQVLGARRRPPGRGALRPGRDGAPQPVHEPRGRPSDVPAGGIEETEAGRGRPQDSRTETCSEAAP